MDSISSLSLESEEYIVEEILRKRIGADGKPEYFLKWEGYGHDENTWEPVENINAELVSAFEKELEVKQKKSKEKQKHEKEQLSKPSTGSKSRAKIPATELSSNQQKNPSGCAGDVKNRDYREKKEADDKPNVSGFDRGLEADEMLGANNENGGINVLIKWKGNNGVEMVPTSVARFKCPDVLIKFYEENFIFAMSSSKTGI
ncbi:Heterochromatin protein 1 [Orchesella cincta]|uniref:Heterochromatin protein 1 n=1 Tax=Orchesella cincta TaxID=48709 RepID=A0A1D2MGA8_ORCCI|nr:Heterochromatin protein 1 [Orchesella cincta]